MKKKIFYDGIYGRDSIKLIRELVNVAPIENTMKNFNWKIRPHVHNNLMQIFLIEEGSINLLINDNLVVLDALSFFTVPKNVVHGFTSNPDTVGWVISLSDTAIERMLAFDSDLIFDIDTVSMGKIDMQNSLHENLFSTIKKCINEYYGNLPGKDFALEYLVGMLLIRLYRIPKQKNIFQSSDNSYKLHYRRFLNLIRSTYSFKKNIDEYAKTLSITPGHLNRICKTISNKTPRDIIIDFFMSEAKSKMVDFNLSIADIGYELGFEDASYFSRLFKSRTHKTPTEYRKELLISKE